MEINIFGICCLDSNIFLSIKRRIKKACIAVSACSIVRGAFQVRSSSFLLASSGSFDPFGPLGPELLNSFWVVIVWHRWMLANIKHPGCYLCHKCFEHFCKKWPGLWLPCYPQIQCLANCGEASEHYIGSHL